MLPLRPIIALAGLAGWLSRVSRQGSGVMVSGRLLLKIAPHAVRTLSRDKKVILVSGTNGKTTTTSLIYHALASENKVATNFTGANLFAGIAETLGRSRNATLVVLEVDEMVMPWAIDETKPRLIVLLNLGRDQLDRLSEVRQVAQKWKTALTRIPPYCVVLADADDPFVTWAAKDWVNVIWFTSGAIGHIDASTCPECGIILDWSKDQSTYSCTCGFKKPQPEWIMRGNTLTGPERKEIVVRTAIPGAAAMSNAGRAIVAASIFKVDGEKAAEAIASVSSVDGRFGKLTIGATTFRLLLSKNPASWRETLTTSALGPKNVLLVVNANTQDGKDTSWLWDVDFSPLQGRNVIVTGERKLDLSVRLTVNEIPHQIADTEAKAATIFGASEADIIASYTAFHRLSKLVKRR
ncbi:MAG: DUF1727 domain-containing protein [Actinobacteria bacterium]|uniref:Unannotated protein n=1 Tax=freshwater metagenome TaxID=449393 RepID=A0A6J7CE15_9ZZZZ|nr:DUF1727 domain-containing protein [Actinomycetota bacterium]MSX24248.1 DUF1727 domain-containing protein [Actinomycetota bacterium]MSY46877.1 DUF1727 domain-containing protein [Actinomycetota bacterium]MSY56693.1 DUF1727 domain-containing protein [Actinomycetota bacterium]MTB00382.1 DUF1727 domain-containing protein [Actinomycetota bacterium]